MAVLGALLLTGTASAQETIEIGPPSGDILEEVDRILGEVVAVRGLEPKEPIPAGLHSRESLREALLAKLAEEVTPERVAIEARILARLGVLPADVDYYDLMVELLTSQIAGFYDEDTGELFLIDDLAPDVQAPTMAHELFHGIQDQLFGIENVRPDWEEAEDAMLAATALIEGDAVGLMIDFSFGGTLSFTDIPNFLGLVEDQLGGVGELAPIGDVEIPSFLQDELLFPYLEGLSFVHYLKSAGGWAAVDAAYEDPPMSSEQVLHPERYLDRDRPTWLTLTTDTLEAVGFSRAYDSVFGEFRWRSLLRQGLGETVSARAIDNAAAGWDGDRAIGLVGPEDHLVLLALTVWDSPGDAREFESLLLRYLEERDGVALEAAGRQEHGASSELDGEYGRIFVERWGDMVLWIDGAPEELGELEAEAWPALVWRGRGRGPYPPAPNGGGVEE